MNTNSTNEQTAISEAEHIFNTCANLVEVNNLCSKLQEQELYVQIKDEVADHIIKHALSKAESGSSLLGMPN
jgi:hypothetical protein